jgi:ornithine cyclodeaminase
MTSMRMRYLSGADMDSPFTLLRGQLSEKKVSWVKVVVDDWRESQSGNPRLGAVPPQSNAGLLSEERVPSAIGDVVAGERPGREREDEPLPFWHRGLSTTDSAGAHMIFRRAEATDVGMTLPYR